MVTVNAALDALGEETATELLERSFDLLTAVQRRFLVARIETDTDAEAIRRAHTTTNTVAHWRATGGSFEKIYLAAKRSTPAEMAEVNSMRFGYVAGKCLNIIEEFVTDDISADDVGSGVQTAKQQRANFALSLLRELRSRSVAHHRANEKRTSLTGQAEATLSLTQESMVRHGASDPDVRAEEAVHANP